MKSSHKLLVLLLEEESQNAVSVVVERVVGGIFIYLVYVLCENLCDEEVFALRERLGDHLPERHVEDWVTVVQIEPLFHLTFIVD